MELVCKSCVLGLALLAGGAPGARAGAFLPVSVQVPLILKLLSYEKTLMSEGRDAIRIGLLYDVDDPASRSCFEDFQTQLSYYAGQPVGGHRVDLVPLPVARDGVVPPEVVLRSADVIYVAPGNETRVDPIVRFATASRVPTVTGVEEYVGRGVSIGVVPEGDHARILLNLHTQGAQEIHWDSYLLPLCHVIR